MMEPLDGQLARVDDVTPGRFSVRTMDDLSRLSKMLAASNFFADTKEVAQCGVKVLAGLEMGFGAFASMTGIHIIKGKPSIGANLMAAAVKRHPNYNYRVLEHSAEACRIEFFERWDGKLQSVGVSELTMKEAVAAKLNQEWDKQSNQWKEKHNWKTFPRNMLFARAMSNGVKWYCPDVFDAPVYTPEELGATVNEDGDVIEVQSVPAVETPEPRMPEPKVITQAQQKRLFAIASSNDWQPEDVKRLIQDMLGIDSSSKILQTDYEVVCDALQDETTKAAYSPVLAVAVEA